MQKSANMQNRSLQIQFLGSQPCKLTPAQGNSLPLPSFNPGLRSLPAMVAVMAVVGMVRLMGAALIYGVPTNIKVSELLPTLLDILK